MVSKQLVQKQFKKIGYNPKGWGRGEAQELHNILLPDEEILEITNGMYEGGFAMLLATDVRVLLVDKKPLSFLTVEDLRFDMINEIDYSHRLVGAQINIATGNKKMKFSTWDQPGLRKLINHVQHEMAIGKKKQAGHQEDQKYHLEQINQQLQAYLVAQHQNQLQIQQAQQAQQAGQPALPMPEPVKPSPELADYLFAQSLLAQYQTQQADPKAPAAAPEPALQKPAEPKPESVKADDLYAEGMKEIFGRRGHQPDPQPEPAQTAAPSGGSEPEPKAPHSVLSNVLEVNPMRIAYSKLPMALRNRKFGRPSFHAHSASPDNSQSAKLPEAAAG